LQHEIRDIIKDFINNYPKNHYIITSRLAGYEKIKFNEDEFLHILIQKFSESKKKEFIQKIFKILKRPGWGNALLDILKKNKRINELAENPLMLTIMALMTYKGRNISQESRWELLKSCTDTFLEDWIMFKRLKIQENKFILQQLGFWFHSAIKSTDSEVILVRKNSLVERLKEILKESSELDDLSNDRLEKEVNETLEYIKKTNGLLIEKSEGEFRFPYLIIQEYFAASYFNSFLADINEIWDVIKEKIPLSQWHEVLILYFGILSEHKTRLNKLIKKIITSYKKGQRKKEDYILFLMDCLIEKIPIEKSVRLKILKEFLILLCRKIQILEFRDTTSIYHITNSLTKYFQFYSKDLEIFEQYLIEKRDNNKALIKIMNLIFYYFYLIIFHDTAKIHFLFKWINKYCAKSNSKEIQQLAKFMLFQMVYENTDIKLEEYTELLKEFIKGLDIKESWVKVQFDKYKLFSINQEWVLSILINSLVDYFLIFFIKYYTQPDDLKVFLEQFPLEKVNQIFDFLYMYKDNFSKIKSIDMEIIKDKLYLMRESFNTFENKIMEFLTVI